jgi:biotin operon repressor
MNRKEKTAAAIAAELGVSRQAVYKRLKKEG